MKVFIYGEYSDWQHKYLQDNLREEIKYNCATRLSEERDYDAVIWGRPEAGFIDQLPGLRYIIVPYAGIPALTQKLAASRGISLHNLHHNAIPTAEMAFSLLLAAAKNIIPADNKLRRGDWRPRYEGLANRLLRGRKGLILGYGSVGRYLGAMCQGMQIKLSAIRKNCETPYSENGVQIYPPEYLESLLPQAEVLMVTLPLTEATRNILNQKRLSMLPRGMVLMNIGRGELVEEKALYHCLQKGHIAAAGIDVWYNYPRNVETRGHTYPATYPFWELDNVVLSPHRGGSFANYETELLRVQHLVKMLNSYIETGEMPNKVNLGDGY